MFNQSFLAQGQHEKKKSFCVVDVLGIHYCTVIAPLNLNVGQIFLPNLFQIHFWDAMTKFSHTRCHCSAQLCVLGLRGLEFCSFWYFVGIVMAPTTTQLLTSLKGHFHFHLCLGN